MRLRNALTALLLLYGVSLSSNSVAQAQYRLDIPAGELASALDSLARQTHAEFIYAPEELKGVQTRGVHGNLSAEAALRRLLEGTRFIVKMHPSGAMLITPAEESLNTPKSSQAAGSASGELPEVIVLGTRRAELQAGGKSLQDVAASVTALTPDVLDRSKIWNGQQLQQVTPGLLVSYNGAFGQPYLRGVGTDIVNPGADSPVAVFIDGAYQARQTAALTELFDMERVEVWKGPQGTLYGRNASGGAINLLTRDPEPVFRASGEVYIGNYDSERVSAVVNTPLSDELALRISGLYSRRDGYTVNLVDGSRIDDESVQGLRMKLRYGSGEFFAVILGAEYNHEHDGRNSAKQVVDDPGLPLPVRDLAGQFGYAPPVIPADPLQVEYDFRPRISLDQIRVNATARWRWEHVELASISAYTHVTDDSQNDLDATAVHFAYVREADHSATFTQTLQWTSREASPTSWLAGLEYFNERGGQYFDARLPYFSNSPTVEFAPSTTVAGFVWNSALRAQGAAAFAQGRWTLSPEWALTAGLRYSWEMKSADFLRTIVDPTGEITGVAGIQTLSAQPEHTFPAWTPEFRIEYRPANQLLLYGSAIRGFKSGGFNLMNTAEVFQPEQLWSFEVGVKSSWLDNRLRANVAAFYYDYRDLQVNQFSGVTNLVTNAANSRISGLELDLTALPVNRLYVYGSVALLNARYRSYLTHDANDPQVIIDLSGNTMPHAPRATILTGAELRLPAPGAAQLNIWANARFQSQIYFDQFDTPQLAQPGFWLFNAGLRFEPAGGHWSVALLGTNLGNRIYRQSVIRIDQVAGTVASFGAPLTWGVWITSHF